MAQVAINKWHHVRLTKREPGGGTDLSYVIPTASDGRCAFRSIVTAMNVDLMSANRDSDGYPQDFSLWHLEVAEARTHGPVYAD